MNRLFQLLAGLGVLASLGAALVAGAFGLAGAANAGPELLQRINLGIGLIAALAMVAIIAALRDLRAGRPRRAAAIGFALPVVLLAALFVASFWSSLHG